MDSSPLPNSSGNRYRKVRDLGSGSFGSVQLCQWEGTDEHVAIKHLERGPKIDKHVLYEIKNHRSLQHRHVIQFKEVYLTAEHLCIVMEYAPGGDLLDLVNKRCGLAEKHARRYFQQLIAGLHYCHQMGVANRDIKLENALLDGCDPPVLKICDFGYSKHEHRNSLPGSRVGTPAYLAPEVALTKRGDHYDGKIADIWSCGVFLYAMVFASFPFEKAGDRALRHEERIHKMLRRATTASFRVPSFPYSSPELRDLLFKIVVKDPVQRITVEEIMRHPWFQTDLPEGYMDLHGETQNRGTSMQTDAEIDRIVAEAKFLAIERDISEEYIDHQLC